MVLAPSDRFRAEKGRKNDGVTSELFALGFICYSILLSPIPLADDPTSVLVLHKVVTTKGCRSLITGYLNECMATSEF